MPPGRRIRRLDQRRVGGDGDGLLQLAHFERDVQRQKLLRRDADALALVGLEAGEGRPDGVGAGGTAEKLYSPEALVVVSRDDLRAFVDDA